MSDAPNDTTPITPIRNLYGWWSQQLIRDPFSHLRPVARGLVVNDRGYVIPQALESADDDELKAFIENVVRDQLTVMLPSLLKSFYETDGKLR